MPTYRGDRHVVGPGDLIVLNPEEAHAGGAPRDGTWTYRALYPHPDLIRKVVAVPGFRPEIIRDAEAVQLLRRFHRLSEMPGSSPLERETCFVEALVLLAGRYAISPKWPGRSGQESGAVRLCRDYLEAHSAERVTLEALAGLAGLSPFHSCRVFREAFGMPPHAYQTQIRVRRVKSLLRGGLPVAMAAAQAGFHDQAHLTRHFKRIVGVPPGRWLRAA
jgi:AraC-like DNA-binding protein